jgi:hypothetical protein
MIPAFAGNPSLLRQAMKSVAVNVPLGATVVGTFASIHALIGRRSAAQQRSAFLKSLALSDCPHNDLLRYMDSRDPIEKAKRELASVDAEAAKPLRAALAATF